MTTKPKYDEAHCRPFNIEHAKAGAPVVQKNGNTPRIHVFDRKADNEFIIAGLAVYSVYEYNEVWNKDGICGHASGSDVNLLMAPLGYCEGDPVHMGDKLLYRDKIVIADTHAINVDFDAIGYNWPVTGPEMPELNMTIAGIQASYGFFRGKEVDEEIIFQCMSDGMIHAITHQRDEIAAYLIACGIVSPIVRPLARFSADRLRAAFNDMEIQKLDEFNFQTFTDTMATKNDILDELNFREEPPF